MKLSLGLALLLITGASAFGSPVDLSAPSNSLGASNAHGHLQVWQEITDLDFGKGLTLPFRIEFSSGRQTSSPLLGRGWWCPLLEATCYLKRESMMRAELPCGKVMYLRRDRNSPGKFLTLDKVWTATVDGNTTCISRPDGWMLTYANGRLAKLRTDTGRIISWSYNGKDVLEVREDGSSSAPFRLSTTSGASPNGFQLNNKLHSFELGQRPRVEGVNGQLLLSGLDPSLATWTYPDGAKRTFAFEVTEKLQPTLTMSDSPGTTKTYTWDGATGYILSDGLWNYDITPGGGNFQLPKLKRKKADGAEEFIYVNNKTGITESKSSTNGHTFVQVFKSTGPLYGKVRKIEKIGEGGLKTIAYQAAYNELGRLVRETNASGQTSVFSWDATGKLIGKKLLQTRDESVLSNLKIKEKSLLAQIGSAPSLEKKQDHLQALADFYIHELRDPKKALALVPQLTDAGRVRSLRMRAIDQDPALSPSQKIEGYKRLLEEYPERKEMLLSLIKMREGELEKKN